MYQFYLISDNLLLIESSYDQRGIGNVVLLLQGGIKYLIRFLYRAFTSKLIEFQ